MTLSRANSASLNQDPVQIAALYKFAAFADFQSRQPGILKHLRALNIKGTLLLAGEGMNGTLAGSRENMTLALAFLSSIDGFEDLEAKISYARDMPFLRLKVRLKKEIVTIGDPAVNPNITSGTYVEPKDWNALISDPGVLLIDTRNDYEVGIGTFEGAVDPKTQNFRSFPAYVREHLDPAKHKKVAMFCTGGIRCEKASSFMKTQGFEGVFHLKGGILNYFEQVDAAQSKWQGECFVFDDRVSVRHDLSPGTFRQCFGCRRPLSRTDMASKQYEKGVSCPHCFADKSAQDRRAYRERQRQIDLAKARGGAHLGGG